MFNEVAKFLKICVSKIFFKSFRTVVLSYIVKNILLNFYIIEISLYLVYEQKFSETLKSNHGQMLYKNRSSLAIWLMFLTWNLI